MAKDSILSQLKGTFGYVYNHIKAINDSKLFAGLIVIILNVSSKFTTVPISKTMESYLKNTFSRHILVFAIAWMGTRDVFIALTVTIAFIIVMNVLLDENSPFCCFTEEFMNHHMALIDEGGDENVVSKEEWEAAMKTLTKAQNILKNTSETNGNVQEQFTRTTNKSNSNMVSNHMKSFMNYTMAPPDVSTEHITTNDSST
jgi:hypothetical protein